MEESIFIQESKSVGLYASALEETGFIEKHVDICLFLNTPNLVKPYI